MIYLILLSCFLIRALPRVILQNTYGQDTYFHLYCAQVIRENSLKLPHKLPRVILDNELTYPYLYHLLLALFPNKYRLWAERFTGAIFDTINAVIIYFFSSWIVQRNGYPQFFELPILVTALYAFSPALLRISIGPRAYHGSPRVMAQTLYLLHLTLAYYAFATNNIIALMISLFAGAALIISAKFGNQVLIFFGIIFSLFVTHYYLLMLCGCFVISMALSRGQTIRVIKGQIRHSMFYVKYLQKVYLWPHARTIINYFQSAVFYILNLFRNGRVWQIIQWYYSENYILHLFLTVYPQFLFFPLFSFYTQGAGVEKFLLIWMGAGLFFFLLTKLKWVKFLGEAERYLEYALFPSLFFVTEYLLLVNRKEIIYVLLLYSLFSAICYGISFYILHKKIDYDFGGTEAFFEKLNSMSPGVIWPVGSYNWQTLYRSKFPVLTMGCNIDESLLSQDEFMLVYSNYPYPSSNFREIMSQYDVKYILSDRNTLRHYAEHITDQPHEFYSFINLLFETPTISVWAVKNNMKK